MVSSTSEQQHGLRLVLAIVAVLVVAAMALGAVLLNRGDGEPTQTDAIQPESDSSAADAAAPGEGGAGADGADADGDPDADASATGGSADDPDGGAGLEPCPPAGGDLPRPTTDPYVEQPTVDLGTAILVTAALDTTCGTIVVELVASAAPMTVGNFVALAEDGYYDGVGFHRVIEGFMIQGGDPTGTGTGCLDQACARRLPGYSFADELDHTEEFVGEAGGYPRGTLAMANAGPDTNGSQFFIVQASPGYPLPPNYTVFGQVLEGMDVVDRIALGPVDGDLAVEPVVIRSVQVQR